MIFGVYNILKFCVPMIINHEHFNQYKYAWWNQGIHKDIEKEEFCDVTLAFKDGHRSCNTFVFLRVGKFWKDIINSLQGECFSAS